MNSYSQFIEQYEQVLSKMNRRYTLLGLLRFSMVIIAGFSVYRLTLSTDLIFIVLLIGAILGFFILVNFHQKLADRIKRKETLIKINQDEINFVERNQMPFDNGVEFKQTNHAYSHDLDIFGEHSLFQYLNRTATYVGKSTLAQLLLNKLSNNSITDNQEAVKELADNMQWRHQVQASGIIMNDNKKLYSGLISWSQTNSVVSKSLRWVSFIMPAIFITMVVAYILTNNSIFASLLIILFLINAGIFYSKYKLILKDVVKADAVHESIQQYASILKQIEDSPFKSKKLQQLQSQLKDEMLASEHIKELSSLFKSLLSIQNAFAAILLNGISLYHIHAYHALIKWKDKYGQYIVKWMEIIGETESLSSLANLYYNNPNFCFPELNEQFNFKVVGLGHPLINAKQRICNDACFEDQKFIILTGSNMSGKSTFLRSLGVNMVLANIGSSICASSANMHPMDTFVSMRLSDSLSDDESYFFAEVKRLKQVMDSLKNERGFVLLDEILRGTNSDDKRNGTIEVIKKMIGYKAIGAIATHDLEICNTTEEYPNYLTNKCFEVETINDELLFDYKLRDGVCKNKNATFLMKKMGVI